MQNFAQSCFRNTACLISRLRSEGFGCSQTAFFKIVLLLLFVCLCFIDFSPGLLLVVWFVLFFFPTKAFNDTAVIIEACVVVRCNIFSLLFFLKRFTFIYISVHVCLCHIYTGIYGDHKRASALPELALHRALSHYVGSMKQTGVPWKATSL